MTIREAISSIASHVSSVIWWVPVAGVWLELSWDEELVRGSTYWIHADIPCNLIWEYGYVAMEAGWNAVILYPEEAVPVVEVGLAWD